MSAQAQKFEIFEKKPSLGVRSPCFTINIAGLMKQGNGGKIGHVAEIEINN